MNKLLTRAFGTKKNDVSSKEVNSLVDDDADDGRNNNEKQLLVSAINVNRRETDVKTVYDMSTRTKVLQSQVLPEYRRLLNAEKIREDKRDKVVASVKHLMKSNKKHRNFLTHKQADKTLTRMRKIIDRKDMQDDITNELSDELYFMLANGDDDGDDDDGDSDGADANTNSLGGCKRNTSDRALCSSIILPDVPNTSEPDDLTVQNIIYCKNVCTQTENECFAETS